MRIETIELDEELLKELKQRIGLTFVKGNLYRLTLIKNPSNAFLYQHKGQLQQLQKKEEINLLYTGCKLFHRSEIIQSSKYAHIRSSFRDALTITLNFLGPSKEVQVGASIRLEELKTEGDKLGRVLKETLPDRLITWIKGSIVYLDSTLSTPSSISLKHDQYKIVDIELIEEDSTLSSIQRTKPKEDNTNNDKEETKQG